MRTPSSFPCSSAYPAPAGYAHHHCRSRGFTLLEILLVLAVMVAAVAVALPNLRSSFREQRLQKAGEQIRAEWTRARVQAIKTGQTHVFRHLLYSRRFTTEPLVSWEDELEGAPQWNTSPLGGVGSANGVSSLRNPMSQNPMRPDLANRSRAAQDRAGGPMSPNDPYAKRWRELPDDVVFVGADVQLDQRTLSQMSTMPQDSMLDYSAFEPDEAQQLTETTSGTPIFFFPDGTTSSVRLLLANDQQRTVEVWLRGLTGTVRVGQVQSLDPYRSPEVPLR